MKPRSNGGVRHDSVQWSAQRWSKPESSSPRPSTCLPPCLTLLLRREQIKLQVAVITPLMHVKGYRAPETKTARELNSLTFLRLELTLMSIDAVTCGK